MVLLAAVLWGVWLTFLTEILSLFNALQRYTLAAGWLLPSLGLLWLIYRSPGIDYKVSLPRFTRFQKFLLGSIALILAISGLIALISPPNNWDSMTYHLSRVMHWTQNRSVAHYATHELRQLYLNPWAEFAITNLQILSGSDRFANLVQWLSMVGCVLGVSFIARQLGAALHGQILAALVTATIPMGILQAVTTQNDYVTAFWLVCLVSFILSARQRPDWLFTLGIAGSLGLAIFTKGTAYLFAAPLLAWFGLSLLKTRRGSAWQPIVVIGALVLLINAGHYYRNYQLFGSPLKPQTLAEFDYANQAITPKTFISNIVRSIALHLNLPLPVVRSTVEQSIQSLHRLLDIDPNDPRITWAGTRFALDPVYIHENDSGNFIHLGLIFIAFVTIIKRKLYQKVDPCFSYSMTLIAAFGLFALYLKWQPWHSRLHLPLFVLWSPLIGILLSQISRQQVSNVIALLLTVQALPFLLANPSHPLLYPANIFNRSRVDQYFWPNPSIQEPYLTVTQLIKDKQCHQVGLNLPKDFWEYPLWVLLQSAQREPVQLEAINVDNESAVLQRRRFEPCAVICAKCSAASQNLYLDKFGPPALSADSNFLFIQNPSTE